MDFDWNRLIWWALPITALAIAWIAKSIVKPWSDARIAESAALINGYIQQGIALQSLAADSHKQTVEAVQQTDELKKQTEAINNNRMEVSKVRVETVENGRVICEKLDEQTNELAKMSNDNKRLCQAEAAGKEREDKMAEVIVLLTEMKKQGDAAAQSLADKAEAERSLLLLVAAKAKEELTISAKLEAQVFKERAKQVFEDINKEKGNLTSRVDINTSRLDKIESDSMRGDARNHPEVAAAIKENAEREKRHNDANVRQLEELKKMLEQQRSLLMTEPIPVHIVPGPVPLPVAVVPNEDPLPVAVVPQPEPLPVTVAEPGK